MILGHLAHPELPLNRSSCSLEPLAFYRKQVAVHSNDMHVVHVVSHLFFLKISNLFKFQPLSLFLSTLLLTNLNHIYTSVFAKLSFSRIHGPISDGMQCMWMRDTLKRNYVFM